VVAVALVAGGIVGLQRLVPADKDSPAVVRSPAAHGPAPSRTPAAPRTSAPPASSSAAVTPSPTSTALVRPALTVLNNSKVNGLAKKAAADFAAGGWRIAGTGNLGGRLPRTTVYYGPGQRDAAEALRRQFPAIEDLAPRSATLPGGGGLTVVVTRDYPH
jgi:hypothetical protein